MTKLKISELSGLDHIIMVAPEIRMFSGVQALSENDLGDETLRELPREVVSWGSKRLVDAQVLAPFSRIKKAVERTALSFGTRFLGGYAVPVHKIDECLAGLDAHRLQFEQEKTVFLRTYPQHVRDWADAHPQWGERILASAQAQNSIDQRINFHLRAWRIVPSGINIADNGLLDALNALPSTVLREVMQDIFQVYENAKPRGYCSQRVRRCFERGASKLASMRLIDMTLGTVAALFTELLAYLPQEGLIEGVPFAVMGEAIELIIATNNKGQDISCNLKDLEAKVIRTRLLDDSLAAAPEDRIEEDLVIAPPAPVIETAWAF